MPEKLKKRITDAFTKLAQTGFFHIFGSSVINKIIGFVSGVILVRILSKVEYGTFSYAKNIYGFFILLSGAGMTSVTLQLCSETEDQKERCNVFAAAYRYGLTVNLLLSIAILTVSITVPFPVSGANPLLASFCLLPMISFCLEQQQAYLRSELRNREFSYTNTVHSVLLLVFSVGLSIFHGAYGIVAAEYASAAITLLFMLKFFRIFFPKTKPNIGTRKKRKMWSIGSILMLNNGLTSLMYLLDIFVIGMFIPDQAVIASYKVATAIPSSLIFIPTCIMVYVYPYFARNKDNREWTIQNFKKLICVCGAVNTSIAVLLIACSGTVIPLLFGNQYSDSVPCFVILCISFALSGTFRTPSANLLVTQLKLKFNLFVAVLSGVFNTVMNVILVNRVNSIGAAFATLLTAVLTGLLNTGYLIYVYKRIPANIQKQP